MPHEPYIEENPALHDVIIVGAGPCGLAVAARLREKTPAALFTDDEHQRYQWIKRHSGRMNIRDRKNCMFRAKTCTEDSGDQLSILVLDSSGEGWMSRWNRLFHTYAISHLRSPMFFHVDPRDRDGLLAFTHEQGWQHELEELRGCVGKELSKHRQRKKRVISSEKAGLGPIIDERDRNDYYTPSQTLFSYHCTQVATRYQLDKGLIRQEKVADIEYAYNTAVSDTEQIFTVNTEKGTRYARNVVLAIGPGNTPCIPGMEQINCIPGACHSMCIDHIPDTTVATKIKQKKETHILIVGGGLTSAQIADQAIRRGVSKVWLILRGPLKVKHFDIDLKWVGKYRNVEKAVFWSADTDQERRAFLDKARNGGSINPKFYNIIKNWTKQARLSLHTHTTLASQTYDAITRTWTITTDPPIQDLPRIDYVYWATGVATNYAEVPCLCKMNEKFPIQGYGGLPCITDDLMWKDDVPLYVTGKLASLRLGPAAPNLEGARLGAERIAWSISERMGSGTTGVAGEVDDAESSFGLGIGSRYDVLAEP